ncbi:hypothetical protein LC593_04695 [Nostoc sp. CHAB 5844]|nr:hypothetical protein [Nostoc sp. CHAB 5844]
MAFPIKDFVDKETIQQRQIPFNPQELLPLREVFLKKLLSPASTGLSDQVALQISRLVQIQSRSASNEITVYDNTKGNSSYNGAANSLTKQVERAFIQVLGGAPGRGSDRFMKALVSAFPTGKDGQVTFTPVRSVISLSGSMGDNGSKDWAGQLSVEQASLYREASLIVSDALRLLEGIEPFDPKADLDAVEALRALIRSNLNYLIEEFGRIDKPRRDFVDTYFVSLKKNIRDFGEKALLINCGSGNPNLVTAEDESQIAAYELIKTYVQRLESSWNGYLKESKAKKASDNYSERLARVNVMLPVVAEGIASVMDAMDSVGFTESERRSDTALFSKLESQEFGLGFPKDGKDGVDANTELKDAFNTRGFSPHGSEYLLTNVSIPRITVNDFSEWVERFASREAPSILGTSGRFGLDFVTDQADTLFWVIGIVLDYLKFNPDAQQKDLGRILAFDRVQQTLIELVSHLKTLADLGVNDPRFV